jgi:hypothetical protein
MDLRYLLIYTSYTPRLDITSLVIEAAVVLDNPHIASAPPEAGLHEASNALRSDFFGATLSSAMSAPSEVASLPAAAPSEVPSGGDVSPPAGVSAGAWQQMQQWASNDMPVKFVTGADGQVPDYILGADGNLTANPAKGAPSSDGSVTVQVDNSQGQAAAKKAAQQYATAVAQQKIAYWQKAHPNSTDIPMHLQGELAAAQNAGGPEQAPRQDVRPNQGAPSFGGPGSESIGNRNIGNGGYRQGNFEPNGPIDRNAIPQPVAGDLNIKGPPSCNAEQIQTFLEKMGSPAAKEQGFSQALYDACTNRGIDPAVAVGFFLQESTCGRYGRGHYNHSMGNIKGTAPESGGSDGTFRSYGTWAEGARDWARLIDESYVQKRGLNTLSQVIGVYAPGSDGNNEHGYVATVKGVVEAFKAQNNNKNAIA